MRKVDVRLHIVQVGCFELSGNKAERDNPTTKEKPLVLAAPEPREKTNWTDRCNQTAKVKKKIQSASLKKRKRRKKEKRKRDWTI
jgi:hypothetical protein